MVQSNVFTLLYQKQDNRKYLRNFIVFKLISVHYYEHNRELHCVLQIPNVQNQKWPCIIPRSKQRPDVPIMCILDPENHLKGITSKSYNGRIKATAGTIHRKTAVCAQVRWTSVAEFRFVRIDKESPRILHSALAFQNNRYLDNMHFNYRG